MAIDCFDPTIPLSIRQQIGGCWDQPALPDANFIVIGSHIAASRNAQRLDSATGRVYAEYRGDVARYRDPVRGASTSEWGEGSVWGLLGDMLVNAGKYNTVTFTVIARPSAIYTWDKTVWDAVASGSAFAGESPMYDTYEAVLERFRYKPVTAFIVMIGEMDVAQNASSEAAYFNWLGQLGIRRLDYGITAPMYFAVNSWVDFLATTVTQEHANKMRNAQIKIADNDGNDLLEAGKAELYGFYPGPDIDAAAPLAGDYRSQYDGLHLSLKGQQAVAQAWFEVLQ